MPKMWRKGKYGLYYGCSNFPKCRYTKKVSCFM
ncbi:topoisomerase DNA-binding C4 zinc finger domain-containing protein [Virgibacillus sp. SK37]